MIEWVDTPGGAAVPVRAGILLASKVDPIKEAESWMRQLFPVPEKFESHFILGLGGGFHVRALAQRYPDRKIVVIEKDSELAQGVLARVGSLGENVGVFSPRRPPILFSELEIQDVLTSQFCIFRHPTSVRLEPDYYKEVEDLLSGRSMAGFQGHVQLHPSYKNYFEDLDYSGPDLKRIVESIQRRGAPLEPTDLLWLALRELVT